MLFKNPMCLQFKYKIADDHFIFVVLYQTDYILSVTSNNNLLILAFFKQINSIFNIKNLFLSNVTQNILVSKK